MDWVFLSELAINGALTGLLYSLFAIGLVLIYKASSVPNLAQGGLTMVGAYVVLALAEHNADCVVGCAGAQDRLTPAR